MRRIRQGSYLQAMAADSADYPEKELIEGCWEFLELSGGGRAKLEAYLPNASNCRIGQAWWENCHYRATAQGYSHPTEILPLPGEAAMAQRCSHHSEMLLPHRDALTT